MDNSDVEVTVHNSPCSDVESINPETSLKEEEDDELLIVDLIDDYLLPETPISDPENSWDEPEPELDFDPDLSEPLYVEVPARGLSKTLRIGEFLSSVQQLDEGERSLLTEILGAFTTPQLSNWLRWLPTKDWNGDSLLLFMEFWLEHWLETPEWWELTLWSKDQHRWI